MTITSTHAEVEQLFVHMELKQAQSVCITSDIPQAGVTSIAMALTERYMLAGYRTLLVDFNTFRPSFEALNFQAKSNLIQHETTNQLFAGLVAPKSCQGQMPYRSPVALSNEIETWLQQYDRVVFDTAPLLQCNRSNIPAPVVAGQCNATLLMSCGGKSTKDSISSAIKLLEAAEANILGITVNHYQQQTFEQSLQGARVFHSKLMKRLITWLEKYLSIPVFKHPV